MQPREGRLQRLKDNPEVSVLIIGAGINGIGTFRDLALQGVDVVMVDRGDYCSGASSASSHMVHGGIRYLENGEFRLVREAVQERNRLIENAAHLVKPLPTTIPIFKFWSGLLNAPLKFMGLLDKPSERGAIVIKLGMLFYDYFTRGQKTVPKHEFRNKTDSLALFPSLNRNISFTGTYFDGAMPSPERICIELIQDAVNENPNAIPLNYMRLVSAEGKTATLEDQLTGEQIQVKPQVLVNAAGPWIDLVNGSFGKTTEFISGTKGSHLILDHPELRAAIKENEFFFENNDGRIVLIYPIYDKVMLGTSDIRIDHPDDAVISQNEVVYFFDMLKRVFPKINVNRSHIVYTFSGVRPLQHTEAGTTGQISRDHKVKVIEEGVLLDVPVLSLVGGKWTSFRAFSEQAADLVLEKLSRDRKTFTRDLKIGGSKGLPKDKHKIAEAIDKLHKDFDIDPGQLAALYERYGTNTKVFLADQGASMERSLTSVPEISIGEIKHITINEDVVHLDDLFLRRTMLGKMGRITPESLQEISRICAEVLNWDEEKTALEMDRYILMLKEKHKMDFNKFISE